MAQPISCRMHSDPMWTFARRDERVRLRREPTADGLLLVVDENGSPRSYFFNDLDSLIAFQSDMEAFLVRTGWSLLEFSPDRRTGFDRRKFPRIDERRRWWTDGIVRSQSVARLKDSKSKRRRS
jgi:hypothetical protein